IRTAQNSAGNPAAIEIPHPTGPAVFLNKNALAKIGLPDTNRFPDRAAALLDWGARASSLGFNHSLDLNKFAHAAQTSATKETGEQLILANGWNPFFTQQIKESKHTEALNFAAQNIELTFNNIAYKQPFANQSYEDWHKINKPMTAKSKAVMESTMAGRSNFPKFSIIMPVFNTPIQELKSAIDSVQSQVYPNWELIIVDDASTNEDIRLFLNEYESSEQIRIERRSENGHICQASNDAIAVATGDWMLCLDHDDTVEPYALYMLASEIVANENLVFIYSDSDKISPDGKLVDPYFTPDFNYDLLLAQNYVTHLSAYKLDIVKGIGGYRKGYEGSQDWDLTLRYLTATGNIQGERSGIKHIPHVLYHWRQSKDSVSANIMNKPYARQAGIQAVADHLKETKQNCSITPHNIVPIFNMVRFLLPKDQPKASIIIQTKDNHEQLGICVNSILEKTAYNNYEIIVMDNGWRKDALKNIKKNDKVKLFSASGPFNYAKTNNTGADYASGEFLCFLNDDTQIIESSWLLDLVALAARPWTGAVGPRLLYPDGHVQQAGTIIDLSMPAGQKAIHAFQREQVASPGVGGRGVLAAEWSAVTGACLVIEKRKYQEMNGMDANQFPLDYNDVDLCLRLMKAGYKNVCAGHIIVLHHEGMSKKKNKKTFTDEQVIDSESAFAKRHEGFVDPYLNANQQFHPHLRAILTAPPQLPFNESIERESMLVINGGHKEAIALYFDDVKAFCMNANGHTLGFSYPRMDRVAILDSRDSPSDLLYICHMLGISKILMNGIGNSTYGLIDYLLEAEKYGIEVIYHFVESEKEERLPDEIKAFIWAKARKIDLAALEAEVDNADAA
ncbi:MAG: glycosyltransferase, partial [Pseudomonadota bacterium]|nr:glycosyltransferase [Pseudomonadota bacterium]